MDHSCEKDTRGGRGELSSLVTHECCSFFLFEGEQGEGFFFLVRSYSISKQVGDRTHKWQATSFVDPTRSYIISK